MHCEIDYATKIGKSHDICEDYIYAIAETSLVRLAVSDGCSSSFHTDIGARILTWSAIKKPPMVKTEYGEFRYDTIREAYKHSCYLFPNSALDATLIFAQQLSDNAIKIFLYGDGNIILVKENNDYIWVNVNSHNLPYYPSYSLEESRNEEYLKYAKENNATTDVTISTRDTEGKIYQMDSDAYNGEYFVSPIDTNIKYVILCSDGIESFVDINTGKGIPTKEIIEQLIDFRNDNGEFVKRRVKRLIDDYAKKKIYNIDDLSVGVIKVVK
jgi:hypothetical protein